MLAIVFWNARRESADAVQYSAWLKEFHRALNQNKPAGFRFSTTYRVAAVPWFKPKAEIYEDWYVLANFAAMDALDKAVLNDKAAQAHGQLMASTAGASGAIYYLTMGQARMESLPVANWLSKPRDMNADDFVESAKAQEGGMRCSFWTRAMALGPTEHCLLTSQKADLPRCNGVVRPDRRLVWSPSME